jgi:hypothetical protein
MQIEGCAFCDNEDYGGTFAFRGQGVVEQTIALDMCGTHWKRFWTDITQGGWIPPGDDWWRLCRLYEEDGTTIDAFETTHEVEVKTDDPYNGSWRLTDDTEDREDVSVDDGYYRMTLQRKSDV